MHCDGFEYRLSDLLFGTKRENRTCRQSQNIDCAMLPEGSFVVANVLRALIALLSLGRAGVRFRSLWSQKSTPSSKTPMGCLVKNIFSLFSLVSLTLTLTSAETTRPLRARDVLRHRDSVPRPGILLFVRAFPAELCCCHPHHLLAAFALFPVSDSRKVQGH